MERTDPKLHHLSGSKMMKGFFESNYCMGFAVALMLIGFESAQASGRFSNLEKTIRKLEKSGNKISTEWLDLTTGKVIFQSGAQQALNPASVIKLVTGHLALRHLGLGFKFKTEFFGDEKSLCVKGSGDPSTVSEEMFLIAQNLQKRGIQTVPDKIVLDDSVFDDEWIPEERTDSDSERAYNAPVGGLNFNYNSATVEVVRVKTDSKDKISCQLDWPHAQIDLNCSVKSSGNTNITISKTTGKNGSESVRVTGSLGKDEDSWRKPFRVMHPSITYGRALQVSLQMLTGQQKEAKLERGKCDPNKDTLFTWESRPLAQIVQLMNKYSNNFIADSFTKKFAAENFPGKPGNTTDGAKWMTEHLQNAEIPMKSGGRALVSGSGLTRGNFLSASDFNKIWNLEFKDGSNFPEFAASNPVAGLDGTLRRKYKGAGTLGRFRAKTGSLNGVVTISGIYPTGSGKWIAVTWLQNGPSGIPEDEVAKALLNSR